MDDYCHCFVLDWLLNQHCQVAEIQSSVPVAAAYRLLHCCGARCGQGKSTAALSLADRRATATADLDLVGFAVAGCGPAVVDCCGSVAVDAGYVAAAGSAVESAGSAVVAVDRDVAADLGCRRFLSLLRTAAASVAVAPGWGSSTAGR